MHIIKFFLKLLGLLVVLSVGAGVWLYISTEGSYLVPATVDADPELPRIETEGYVFHGETYGDPSRQTVVVLHGGPGADYRSLLELKTLEDRYHVVFYDQRGAGLSPRVDGDGITLAQNLEDLTAIIAKTSPNRPVVLIGHSWGAMLAAAYMGVAPEKIERAVLMEPGFFDAKEAAAWQKKFMKLLLNPVFAWKAVRAGFEARGVDGPDDEARNDYLVGHIVHAFANIGSNRYHCEGEDYDAPSWRFGATASRAMDKNSSDADYDSIGAGALKYRGKVLVLASECNDWIGEDLQRIHLGYFTDRRIEIIPASGHDMIWDNPEATLKSIRTFLSE